MSIWQLIKLDFGRNTAHFGELGIGMEETSERVYSDTLFSAWMSSYARLFGADDVKQLLDQFPCEENKKTPPFVLSSTFIYSKNEAEYIYYLPKPLAFPKGYPVGEDLKFTKTYKKLKYLPLKIWRKWYQTGGFTNSDELELIEHTLKGQDKSGCLYKAGTFSYGETYKTHRVPKVAIDRITHATNIYHTGFVQYQWESPKQSGLYFLIRFPEENPELQQKLKASLRLLGEEGIGGERSSGAGRFEVEWCELPDLWKQIDFNLSEKKHHSLISLFWEQPLLCTPISYSIIERGGWVSSGGQQIRRKKVRMLGEGSVFSEIPKGQLADVTPDKFNTHKVYRSGISLSLPIIIQPQES